MKTLTQKVIQHILENDTSFSKVQRDLEISYNECANVFEILENLGILGEFRGSNHRELLIKDIEEIKELIK